MKNKVKIYCLLFLFMDLCSWGNINAQNTKHKTTKLKMVQTDNGKWVIKNHKKKILYEVFLYDNGPDANAQTYKIVITPQFDCAFPFENGKAKVSNNCKTIKDGEHNIWMSETWQYVDKNGKF
jgi:hypothetical protein